MTRRTALAPLALSLLLVAPACAAQQGTARRPASSPRAAEVRVPSTHAAVRQALATIERDNAWTLEQQVSICEIPAPPFKEQARAAEFRKRLAALGLQNVRIDREGNVIGERPGEGAGPVVVLSAHLDTVFPEGTDVKVKRAGTRLTGPGIGDDCRGLAVLLAVARSMEQAKVRTRAPIWFVGIVGEEGAGNLRGVRALYAEELKGRESLFISVDGTGTDVVTAAVGSNRYRVRFQGPGGHSYGAFGMPNPMHAMGRAIAGIADLRTPSDPKTTFNVGVVAGGTSVNSIAREASMDIDMRSETPEPLARLDSAVRAAIAKAVADEKARWPESNAALAARIDTIGIRPASRGPGDGSFIVRAALESAKALGVTSRTGASSTDANVPMALGVPAITVDGGGKGGGAHSLEEWYDDEGGAKGAQWVALLTATLAGVR